MKKNAFTLIELLAVIVILGAIMLIAVPSFQKYVFKTEDTYYKNLEKTLETAAIDYVSDHRNLLPNNVGSVISIQKEDLINGKYIEDIVDTKEKSCEAQALVQMLEKGKYEYIACINCENYVTNDKKCLYSPGETDDYKILVDEDIYINQGDESFILPKAKVELLGVILGYVEPKPEESYNINVLGDYKVTYKYQGITKTMMAHVVDRVKPTIPEVVVTYSDGSRYDGTSSNNLKIDVSSTDFTKPGLQGSGVSKFLYSYDKGETWNETLAVDEKATITKTGDIDTLWVKAKDNSGNESEIRKLATAVFADYNGTVKETKREIAYLESNGKIRVVVPAISTYTGNTTVGWANSSTSYTKAIDENSLQTISPGNYYAVYNWTLNITYNGNGGSTVSTTNVSTKFNSSGNIQEVTATISNTKPTREGYTFKEWSSGSSTYQPGATVSIKSNLVLTASWTINTYVVKFDANGGSGAPASQTKTYGQTLVLSATKPTRSGYLFVGWATSSTATSKTYDAGGNYTANAGTTLYAVWKVNNKVIFSPTKGVNEIGAIGSWSVNRWSWAKASKYAIFELQADSIYAAGKRKNDYGSGITVTSPSISTSGFNYICIQAKIGPYSNSLTIDATGGQVVNNFNGTKCFPLNGATSTTITMSAYADYDRDDSKGTARLYKAVLTNSSSLDLTNY